MLIWLDFRSGRAVRISVNVIGRLVNSKTSRTFVAALDIKNPHVLDEGLWQLCNICQDVKTATARFFIVSPFFGVKEPEAVCKDFNRVVSSQNPISGILETFEFMV